MSLSLTEIDNAIDALLDNASQLTEEAKVLLDAGRFARAFALAQLAREELSKSMMLQAAGARLVTRVSVCWKKLKRRLRNHTDKLRLESCLHAIQLYGAGHAAESEKLLSRISAIANYQNDLKNAALYVGIKEGAMSTPSNLFDKSLASDSIALAHSWLQDQRLVRSNVGRFSDMDFTSYDGPNLDATPAELRLELLKKLSGTYTGLLNSLRQDRHKAADESSDP